MGDSERYSVEAETYYPAQETAHMMNAVHEYEKMKVVQKSLAVDLGRCSWAVHHASPPCGNGWPSLTLADSR